jgi:hypothetical protein
MVRFAPQDPDKPKPKPEPEAMPNPFKQLDPLNVGPRLYNQMSELLEQLETKGERVTMRERTMALVAIGRLQQIMAALRKAQPDDERSGTAVKKYTSAFAPPDAAGRRKANARPEPEDWFEHADVDRDGDEPDDAAE